MTNYQIPMTNEAPMLNDETALRRRPGVGHWESVIGHCVAGQFSVIGNW
jgi:hypothetical protein